MEDKVLEGPRSEEDHWYCWDVFGGCPSQEQILLHISILKNGHNNRESRQDQVHDTVAHEAWNPLVLSLIKEEALDLLGKALLTVISISCVARVLPTTDRYVYKVEALGLVDILIRADAIQEVCTILIIIVIQLISPVLNNIRQLKGGLLIL